MGDILVRNVPDDLRETLKSLASAHRRSLSEEVRSLLDKAVGAMWLGWYEVRFGRAWTGRFQAPAGWKEGTFSRKRILELLKSK